MHDRGKSDGPVVPAKPPNNAQGGGRRWWREGDRPRGTRPAKHAPDAVPGMGVSSELERVRRVARKDRDVRFTALLHHVTSIGCGRRIGRSARTPPRGLTA